MKSPDSGQWIRPQRHRFNPRHRRGARDDAIDLRIPQSRAQGALLARRSPDEHPNGPANPPMASTGFGTELSEYPMAARRKSWLAVDRQKGVHSKILITSDGGGKSELPGRNKP